MANMFGPGFDSLQLHYCSLHIGSPPYEPNYSDIILDIEIKKHGERADE